MKHDLGTEKISRLLWQLSIPAVLGMLSSAIFNIVDRIFVEKINDYTLTAVGITMPIQVLQMAFVLLIGIGSSSLVSIKLGEGKKEEAEDVLYLALKYILIFLSAFAVLFLIFIEPCLKMLAVPDKAYPYAKTYIVIIIVGSIIGIPGYCLNNSLRSIGQAKTSMKIVMVTSILNMILDPVFIFGFHLGIAGAAIATVLSQVVLTVYVIYAFSTRTDFMIQLKRKKVKQEWKYRKDIASMGTPSFLVQLLATAVNIFVNNCLLKYGTDLDIAAVTIISSIFTFYHMVVMGFVQGNNAICGFNWGAKQYRRVKQSLELTLCFAFVLSLGLFGVIEVFPKLLVDLFTRKPALQEVTIQGIRLYLCMIPLVGLQSVSAQYFQAVGKSRKSSVLVFLRYGIIIIPSVFVLGPVMGVRGIYLSNAVSDGIASVVAVVCIIIELRRLNRMCKEDIMVEQIDKQE